jgi:hypothetical protein
MKKIVILSFSLLLCCLSIFAYMSKTNALSKDQADVEFPSVGLGIQILDIDQAQKTAQLQINVYLDGYPYNESTVTVLVTGGGGEIPISCNQTVPLIRGWDYHGESAQEPWLMDGIGETFPFDSYILHFHVQSIDFVGTNFTLASTEDFALFSGGKAYSLNDLWITNGNSITISSSSSEIDFSIKRSNTATIVDCLEFLGPIIACYYLLGSTLMLDLKKHLSERVEIYVSLFVFVPIFLIAIRDFLPYHSTLSFPELLLVNLVLSIAIFAIFSIGGRAKTSTTGPQIIRLYRHEFSLGKWDSVGAAISLFLFVVTYYSTIMWKVNIPVSFVLTYLVIPGYLCSFPFLITRRQFAEGLRRYLLIILLVLIPAIVDLVIWLLSSG